MGGIVKTGVVAHDNACYLAEAKRQSDVVGVASSAAGQVVMNNAEIAYHRAIVASCRANNNSQGLEASLAALKQLGVNA
jgi:hypothetical protein